MTLQMPLRDLLLPDLSARERIITETIQNDRVIVSFAHPRHTLVLNLDAKKKQITTLLL